jgi:regulatory protein
LENTKAFALMDKGKKYLDAATALQKLQRFCAYQERSHGEVRSKLIELGVYGDNLEMIIVELIQDNFLNEERFARIYARGKFNIKRWGKVRIKQELKQKKISDYCIKKAMEEILEEDYVKALNELVIKKANLLQESDRYKLRQKLFTYLLQKGYEIERINVALDSFLNK